MTDPVSRKGSERRLEGKVAIVTGAGSKTSSAGDSLLGTGKAIAVQMAREGASVLVVDRHDDRAKDTCRMIENEGGKASPLVLELTDPSASRRIADTTLERFGRIDILVANAAAYPPPGFLDLTQEELETVIAVNLVAPTMQSQAVIPAMIEAGGGSIIYISSILAMRGPCQAPYAASKAGLMGLVTSLTNAFGPQGIRFNCVAPGMVDTPVRRALAEKNNIDLSKTGQFRGPPLNIPGDAWDIAHATTFLASDEGRYITGHLLPVDGGTTTRMF